MPTLKRLVSAVETPEQIMNELSHDESNTVCIKILPPNNAESLTNDKEVQDDDVTIDNGLPSDVCGMVQVQKNFLNGEDNDDEVKDDDNVKEEQTKSRAQNEKEKLALELLKDVEEYKSKLRSWINKIPNKNQYLEGQWSMLKI